MSALPSPNAIRSKLYREERKRSPVPPDVKALLERGLRERLELQRQAKAVTALAQIEMTAANKIIYIQNVKHPAIRARLLGELADWIIERRETLTTAAGIKIFRIERRRMRRVPAWVPPALAPVYLDPTVSEFEAARIVRAMKREGGGGEA